ncbi:Calcium-transporting ATPase 4, endoplasmic reticulum-type [Hordeum vulgare]|nr:Calcium-transporting ATPase 4, endoplasmic reticulum-type [Hordeum vulgare]
MVFAGTTVVNGSAVCLVVHTGMAIEIGKIHSQIHEALQEDDDTPLKKKINKFGEALTMIIGLICILVWLIKVILGVDRLDMIKGFLQKVLAFDKFLVENKELDSEYKVVLLQIAVPTRSDYNVISCFRNNIPSRLLLAEVMELPNLLLTLLVNEIEDAGFVDEESDGEVKPFPAGRGGFSGGKERAPVSPASVWVLLFALLL